MWEDKQTEAVMEAHRIQDRMEQRPIRKLAASTHLIRMGQKIAIRIVYGALHKTGYPFTMSSHTSSSMVSFGIFAGGLDASSRRGNMMFLWIFGDNIEHKFGRSKFFIIYMAWGIVAGLAHVAVDPASTIPAVGASGAISGVLGAYLAIFPRAKIHTFMMLGFFWRMMRHKRHASSSGSESTYDKR